MSIDLISRALYLRSKADNSLIEKINKWFEESLNIPALEFIVENEKYYYCVIWVYNYTDKHRSPIFF